MRKHVFLSCKSDHVLAELKLNGRQETTAKCRTLAELREFIDAHEPDTVLCSSSIDLPKHSTKDKTIIALCEQIRGLE